MPLLLTDELDVLAAVVHVVLEGVAGPQGLQLGVSNVDVANYVNGQLDDLSALLEVDQSRLCGEAVPFRTGAPKCTAPFVIAARIRRLLDTIVHRVEERTRLLPYTEQLSAFADAILEMRVRLDAVFEVADIVASPEYIYNRDGRRSSLPRVPRATCTSHELRLRLQATFAAAGVSRTSRPHPDDSVTDHETITALLLLISHPTPRAEPTALHTPTTLANAVDSSPGLDPGASSSVVEPAVISYLTAPTHPASERPSAVPAIAPGALSAVERRTESALVNISKERTIPLSPLAQLAFDAEDVQIRTFRFSDEVVSLILSYVSSFNDMSAAAGTSTTWRSVAHRQCPRSWAVVGRVRSRGAAHLAEIFARSENELVSLRLDLDAFYDKSDLQSLTTHLDRVVDLELHVGRSYARMQSWFDTVIRLSKKAMKRLSIHAPQADLRKLHFGTIGSADLQFEVLLAQIPPLSLCSERLAGILGGVARYVALPPYENDLDALARHTAAYLATTPLRPSSIRISTPFRDPRPVLVGAHVQEVVLDQSMSSSWQGVYSLFRDTTYKSLILHNKRLVHVSAPGSALVTSLPAGVPNVTEATFVLWDEGRHVVLRDPATGKTVSFDRVSVNDGLLLWTPTLAASLTRLSLSLYLDALDVYGLLHLGFAPPALEVLDVWIPPRMPYVNGLVSLFAQTARWSGLTSLNTLRLVAASGIDGLPYRPNLFHVERYKVTAFAKRVLGNEGIAVEALGILLMPPLGAK